MKFKIILLLFIIGFSGCIKNVLDRKPLNIVPDDDVWQSEKLMVVYLAALYDNIPIGFDRAGYTYLAHLTDESSHPYAGITVVGNYGSHPLTLNTTMYSWIRRANYFLQQVPTSVLDENAKKAYIAECRFIRAFYYFDLVKKYGGMPIINEVQEFKGDNIDELLVPRNKEDEVYEFILSELDAATADLPDSRDATNSNRATKWSALALKSRAMLYAGSIAKYGTIQLNGLVGIPAEKANKYYQEAFNASKEIIDGGKFSLYTKLYNPQAGTGDPAANYQNIFLDKGNEEIIFKKAYSNPDKRHSYDNYNMPESFKPGCCGNASSPTLEMVEAYEYKDGSPGILDVDGKEFNSEAELLANKDPRFEGTVMYSGTPFVSRPVQIYRGVYDQDGTLYQASKTAFPADPSVLQVGLDGPFTLGDVGKTGFYIKKYLNTATIVPEGTSDQDYIEFRYAEILLNYAEAAFEGDIDKNAALDAINQLRSRAGIVTLTLSDLTLERLRNERRVELAFEDKRFWDMRRWRIGTSIFRSTYVHGLWPYLVYKGGGNYKYIFKKVSGAPLDNGQVRTFNERDYYSDLSGYISTNKNIINNPGW